MSYIALINQPRGLGDIFYLQKAAELISKRVDHIIWPIHPKYSYLKEYNLNPKIHYLPIPLDIPDVPKKYKFWYDLLASNLFVRQFRTFFTPRDVIFYYPFYMTFKGNNDTEMMYSKYPLINSKYDDWQKYFKFNRNLDREHSLRKKYGINEGDKYIFVNGLHETTYYRNTKINVSSDYKIVYNDGTPCHVFDFCWLLENAQEIHTVETSFCYLVEVLNTTEKLYCYSRKNADGVSLRHNNFDYIKKLHKKPWNYIL
jgi:hypothetical protein